MYNKIQMAAQDSQAPVTSRETEGQMIEPEKDLLVWKAPARPFKKRGRDFWVSLIAIAAILGFIFFLIEGVMPVILIISLVFLFYVLSTVEPEIIEYRITNKGIRIAGQMAGWKLLSRFWFGKRLGSDLLIFEAFNLAGRMELVIDSKNKEPLRKALTRYLPEEEIPASNLDRAAGWLSAKLPGNK